MTDIVEGEDYLIDRYAILRVLRDATTEQIQTAFKEQIKQWHPDRLQGLAPELQAQAERRSALLNEARDTLVDPERRSAHDAKLASWKKGVSKDGVPVIDLSAEGFSMSTLVEALSLDRAEVERKARQTALQYSQFDQATYDLVVEQMQTTGDPSPALKKAYRAQIESRNLYLVLYEDLLRSNVGVAQSAKRETMIGYIEQVGDELAELKEQTQTSLKEQVLLLMSGERSLLPAPDGKGNTQALSAAVADYEARVQRHFKFWEDKLKAVSAERQPLIDELFKAANVQYHPANKGYTSQIIVRIKKQDGTIGSSLSFAIEGTNIRGTEVKGLERIDETRVAEQFVERGYSILSYTPVPDIEWKSQLVRVIEMHTEKIEKESRAAP